VSGEGRDRRQREKQREEGRGESSRGRLAGRQTRPGQTTERTFKTIRVVTEEVPIADTSESLFLSTIPPNVLVSTLLEFAHLSLPKFSHFPLGPDGPISFFLTSSLTACRLAKRGFPHRRNAEQWLHTHEPPRPQSSLIKIADFSLLTTQRTPIFLNSSM
jgi:hypothetical protein